MTFFDIGRAVFSCSWGYKLSGPSTLECLASGHWSQAVPRCRGMLINIFQFLNVLLFQLSISPNSFIHKS